MTTPARTVSRHVVPVLALMASLAGPSAAQGDATYLCRKASGIAAVAACTFVLERDPGAAWAYARRATALDDLGDAAEAVADYSRAIALREDAAYFNDRGVSYIAMRQVDRALVDFNRAVELAPTEAAYIANRANAYAILADVDRAAADFLRVLVLDPTNQDARSGLRRLGR